jgi:aspartyl protease family protein
MRLILILAAITLAVAAAVPRLFDRVVAARPPTPQQAMVAAPEPPAPSLSRTVTIAPDRQGHFRVEARIEGRQLAFMVDTGASVIALTARDAARLNLRPLRSDYTATVKTANGTIKAAPVRLAAVDVGGLIVRDVAALVLPDEALSENLLGLSYLSRLRRFEYAGGRLVLEQ